MTTSSSLVSTLWRRSAISAALACVFAAGQASANGTDPTVVEGQASFSTLGSSLSVTNSPGAIINWQGFSIGASETTRFIQQSAASSVLNRVVGSDPSVILGTLTSNGRVFLINPSGILVGQGARIDVAGLVASTLNLSDQDFLAGRLNFTSNPLAGNVENQGSISTPTGGSVYLVGANVSNSGIINSPQGDVILAAGQSVSIFDTSTPGVRVEITASDNAAVNLGDILAQSGEVGIYGAALRNAGIINADQVERDASGKIVLRAKQDVTLEASSRLSANGEQGGEITVQSESGTTLVSGVIEAKGTGDAGKGGTVQLLGNNVGLMAASIDSSGMTGGGTVLVGGDYQGKNPSVQNAAATYMSEDSTINADAITNGDGGKVVLWSNDSTRAYGSMTARGGSQGGEGGLIETSGHWLDVAGINVSASAANGTNGVWLLDPNNITINAAGPDTNVTASPNFTSTNDSAIVQTTSIQTALNGGTSVVITTGTGGTNAQAGDITVADTITWTNVAGPTLTLNAAQDVIVSAAITATTGSFVANAGRDVNVNAATKTTTGNLTSNAGRDVNMTAAMTVVTGNLTSNAGHDVNVTAAMTVTTGDVVLRADNDGTGPGAAGGTVVFTGLGGLTITTGIASIRFNPASYGTTDAEITNYVSKLTGGGTLDAKAWVFVQADNKVYDGTISATASFRGDPTVSGTKDVSLTGGSISFADKSAGVTKTANFTGYSISGAEAAATGGYALFSGSGSTTATISQAPLSVTAANQTKTYGTAFTFLGSEFTSTGLQNSETIGSVTLTSLGAPATAHVAGSPYLITPSAATGGSFTATDYTITYNNASTGFTVNTAALGITANNQTKTYGTAFTFTGSEFTSAGLKNSETIGSVTLTSAGAAATAHVLGSPYLITPSAATGGSFTVSDYTITYNNALTGFTVNTAALGITAANQTKTYGTAFTFAGSEFTSAGLKNSETIGSVTLTSAGAAATAHVAGGPYLITPSAATGGSFTATDYTITYNNALSGFTVNTAALGITAANQTKTYGTAFTFLGSEFTSSGLQNSETIGSVTLTSAGAAATAHVLGSPYAITPSAATGGSFTATDYTITYNNASTGFTVNTAALGITANNQTKTYGTAFTFLGSEFTSTGLQNSETIGSVTLTSLGAPSTAHVVGSPYLITPSAAVGGSFTATDYAITYNNALTGFTVNTAALGITAANQTKTYGTAFTFLGSEFTSTGLQNSETIGSVTLTSLGAPATAHVAGSPYLITPSAATGGSFTATDYTITYNNASTGFTVNTAALGITANNQTKTYGTAFTFTGSEFTSAGLKNSETIGSVTLTSAGAAATAHVLGSPYLITPSAASGGSFIATDYAITYNTAPVGFTVNTAALGITAANQTKTYGTAFTFAGSEFTSAGLKNSETIGSVTLTSAGAAATAHVAGGPYLITPSAATGGSFTATDYTITYNNALSGFTVNTAALGITAANQTKTYGTAFTFTGSEFTSAGLKNSETIGSVTLTSAGAAATAHVLGSPYLITPSAATGGSFTATDYTITYNNASTGFTVNTAALGITANNQTKTYGTAFTFTGSEFTSAGLKNSETIGSVTLTSAGAAAGAHVLGSPYAITPSAAAGGSFTATDYTITYNNALTGFTVTPAPLGIAANSATRLYGDANPAFSATYTGFQNSETAAVLTGTLALNTSAVATSSVGSYAVVPSGQSSTNYTITYVNGSLGVTPAPLGIAANSSSKVYGSTVSFTGTEFSSTGLKNSETIGSVSLASAGAAATAGVAGSPYVITASAASGGTFNAGNYTISYVNGALGVTPAPLGIAANSATRLYGDANPAFSATYTGFQNSETAAVLTGALALNTSAISTSNVGSYSIVPSGQSSTNYTITYVNGSLGVTPAPLGIAANSASKIYGSTLSFTGTEFSSTGLKNSETIGSVSLASTGAAASAGVSGSPYAITASAASGGTFSAGNYAITYVDGALGVTPAPLGIAANSASKIFGDTVIFTGAEFSSTGLKNSETIGSVTLTSSGAVSTAGVAGSPYAITASAATGGTFNSGNYTISYVDGSLGVIPAGLLGIAANAAVKTYDGLAYSGGNGVNYTGFQGADTPASLSGTLVYGGSSQGAVNVGNYSIIPSGQSSPNYTIVYVPGTLGVIPAPLGIAANSATRLYGDANPAFSATYTGFQNSETAAVLTGTLALNTSAVATSSVGSYAIIPSGQSSTNYTITYVNGSLGVTPAPLGIAANSSSKVYGSTVSFTGAEFSSTGLKNSETIGSVSLASAGAAATAGVAGSPYVITASAASGGTFNAGNYTISYVNGALGVTPAPLGIAANSATRLYGDANPAFSATYTGFQNSETAAVLTGTLALNTSAVATSNVGSYAVVPSGQSSTNYTITYVNGSLGVTPAPLGIAANSASKIYGSTLSFTGAEFSSTGLKNSETIGSVSLASAGAAATAGVAGSPYVITASAASGGTFNAGNYTISYVNGALGVTPAPLGIAANSATRLYGDANPAFSATYTGFQNSETAAALTGTLAFATPAIPASGAGSYAIIPSGQSSTNYTIAYVNGTVGVIPVSLMVTADAQSKVYGTSDPALTLSVTGLVNNPALGITDTAASVLSGALTRASGETVLGGPYAITQGTLAANSNYVLGSFSGNTLAITPATLAVTVNAESKVYGTSDPALTFGTTGLVNNPALGVTDTAATVFSGALARASGETVLGGPYAITQGTLAVNSNYILGSLTGNSLTITPAALNVAANPQNKLFGESDPALTFSVTGLVNNPALGIADTAASVLSGALTRIAGESALGGPYAITQGSLAANSNYALGFTPNNLIITGAAAEPVLGFNAGQVIFAGVINNEFYYRPGNFWHVSLNPNNADPGFDVMRGTSDLKSRLGERLNRCDSVSGGGYCETWSFPQQREKVDEK